MPLAVDSQEVGGAAHRITSADPLTWSFTNTAGDLILVGVVATVGTGSGTVSITSVTYNGAALTAIGTGQSYGSGANLVQWFYRRASVATGANTVSVTWDDGGGTTPALLAAAISFSGSDAGTPVGAEVKATGSGTSSATGSISSASTSFVVALVAEGSGTAPSAGSGNTLSASLAGSGATGGDNIGIEYWDSDGSSRDMQFTFPSDSWGTVGVEVLAAASGTTLTPGAGAAALTGRGTSLGFAINMPDQP